MDWSFCGENVFPYGTIEIKSESTNKSFKVNRHRLKLFLTNPSLVDVVVEETSLLHPTSLPPWLKEFSFSVSFFTFIALVQIYWLFWLLLILWLCYIEDNVLFKCRGKIVLCLGFSRLILLFWFYVLCTTLHVSLWILGDVQVMGNCFWNKSF